MEDALQGDHADDLGPKWYMEDQSESLEKVRVLLIVGEMATKDHLRNLLIF